MTAVGMWNRKHPDKQLTYEQFEAVRGLIGVITDADGNFDKSRVTDERVQPLKDVGYTDFSVETLGELVELGKQLEKIRNMAKTVNFGGQNSHAEVKPTQNGESYGTIECYADPVLLVARSVETCA